KQLRELLTIPSTYDILFLPETNSFINEAMRSAGGGSSLSHSTLLSDNPAIDGSAKFLVTQHTENAGTALPQEALARLRERNGDGLIAVDASLALPYAALPYEIID